MKLKLGLISILLLCLFSASAQDDIRQDYLSKEFHEGRRDALRKLMPKNSVAVFFAAPVRNRSNDVDFLYHQSPNLYYLTGYKEPHSMLVIFKDEQKIDGIKVDEMLFVQERNAFAEMWDGKRLGVEGAEDDLGISLALNGKDFESTKIDFTKFNKIFFEEFHNDVRDTKEKADLYDLMRVFKNKVSYNLSNLGSPTNERLSLMAQRKLDSKSLYGFMATLREVKLDDELKLLRKAVEISAVGQLEMMKAMHPDMSELEAQGVHEFVYKKYGAEHEGYPSIVGAGANGCVLHYVDNTKLHVGDNNLILMDLGAEYHGYTADVTRTIPTNGQFTEEQRQIYDLVYEAQEAGIAYYKVGNDISKPNEVARKIINKGLAKLGIIATPETRHAYFPHGTSHHIGLDVHDPGHYEKFKANMVLSMEPGIYIPPGSPCDEKWWGIAVRIEDDILVTKKGPVNLSAMAPRTSSAIEEAMKLPSALTDFVLPVLD